MRIEPSAVPLAPVSTSGARRARRRNGDFTLPEGAQDQEEAAQAVPQPAGLTGAACLLAAASMAGSTADSAAQADSQAAGHGRALLGALAGLQLAAVSGGGGAQVRQTLADLARALPQAADPRLDEVLRAIAQRAAIELARAG